MTEMEERVARALLAYRGLAPEKLRGWSSETLLEEAVREVRIVIEALLYPTLPMFEAGYAAFEADPDEPLGPAWTAMIRAAFTPSGSTREG